MVKCLKCGKKRTETGLNILRPCSYCGTTLQEEIAIAEMETKSNIMPKTIKQIAKEWAKTSPFNKKMAECLSGIPHKEMPIIGIWRKKPSKRMNQLAQKLGGHYRNMSLHYANKSKTPHFYWFPENKILGWSKE